MESARAARFNQRQAGEPVLGYSAEQVQRLIPELRAFSEKGFNVYLTPVDPAHHYLTVQGLTPQRLDGLRADGYVPALVQQSGEADLRAVLKVPRESERDDEKSLADAMILEVNQRWGGQAEETGQGLPLAGFTHHGPAKKSALTVIFEALGVLCMQTLARLTSLRLAAVEDAGKAALTQQSALTKGQAVAKFLWGIEAQVYRRHAAPSSGATPDEVDLEVARKMLKEGNLPAQVRAALRTSPGLAERHLDVKSYVKETVEDAQKALNAPAP